jgi:hypothetical protein
MPSGLQPLKAVTHMNLVLFAGKGPIAVLAAAAGLYCLAGCGGDSFKQRHARNDR